MEPTISTGSLILVDTDVVLYTEDIVTFQKQDSIITHRIVRQIDDQRFITKGDANDSDDPPAVAHLPDTCVHQAISTDERKNDHG